MYNSTFQVSYRRKVYEEVATLAYQRMNKEAFKWLPDWIVSVTGANDAKEDIFSDLDYAAELCSAALGMEPSRYLDTLADKTPLEQTNDPAAPTVCVLSTLCQPRHRAGRHRSCHHQPHRMFLLRDLRRRLSPGRYHR